jgi:hypothetical protein
MITLLLDSEAKGCGWYDLLSRSRDDPRGEVMSVNPQPETEQRYQ